MSSTASTQSENSMAQHKDIYNTGLLASDTDLLHRKTPQQNNTEGLQKEESTRHVQENNALSLQKEKSTTHGDENTLKPESTRTHVEGETLSLEQRRARAFDHAYCHCQNPQLRNIEYEIAEQLEWYRSNDDPYYSSLDYDRMRALKRQPEHQNESRYRPSHHEEEPRAQDRSSVENQDGSTN